MSTYGRCMARKRVKNPRCPQHVPAALCGGLRGSDAPQCRRAEGTHTMHRARKNLNGVGQTTWEWWAGGQYQQDDGQWTVASLVTRM